MLMIILCSANFSTTDGNHGYRPVDVNTTRMHKIVSNSEVTVLTSSKHDQNMLARLRACNKHMQAFMRLT